jgi:hypothetical protein
MTVTCITQRKSDTRMTTVATHFGLCDAVTGDSTTPQIVGKSKRVNRSVEPAGRWRSGSPGIVDHAVIDKPSRLQLIIASATAVGLRKKRWP